MKAIHYLTILCGTGSIGLIFPLLDQQTEIFNKTSLKKNLLKWI
jgi:hypothetical protein